MSYKITKHKHSTTYEYKDGLKVTIMDNPLFEDQPSMKEGDVKIVTDEDTLEDQMKMLALCRFEIMDFET